MEETRRQTDNLKIALVHDWLTGMRGGEKVLEALCELFPHADLFTLLHNPGSVSSLIESRNIFTSFIDRLPFKARRYRHYLPLFPTAVELFDFKSYDMIVSTSHCVAKGVRTPPDCLHISYLHTPMRYVWDMYEDYFGPGRVGRLSGIIIPFFANYLRMWDVTSSNRVDAFVANSRHVAKRIRKYYRREAQVIYPPVDTGLFQPAAGGEDYYLVVSALVPYKKIAVAVEAFNRMGKPLYIIGDGPEQSRLRKMAGGTIRFFDWLPPQEMKDYLARCRALIFPGEEDFGIVPVEAQCCGKPVIAFGKGGALETVIGFDGDNQQQCSGVFFAEQSVEALCRAVDTFEGLSWDPRFIRDHAQRFGKERFQREFMELVGRQLQGIRP